LKGKLNAVEKSFLPIRYFFVSLQKNMNVIDVSKLPNIVQLTKMLKAEEVKKMSEIGGWGNYSSPITGHLITLDFMDNPYHAFCNNGSDNQFVSSKTQSGRMTLTPNLRSKPFLYRGQNKAFPQILSSFEREDLEGKLKHNLLVEDFIALLRTHPVFMMFDNGIKLDGYRDRLFFNMNYYGLGQHYGFKTGVIDFTTDIDVAAFFACTKYIGDDIYEPVKNDANKSYGVIYVHEIRPELTMKIAGFSTIGLQLYPRTGAQKGLLYNQDGRFPPIEKQVTPFYFRHDTMADKHFFDMMNGGKALFPEDSLAERARNILSSKEVSGETFANNLYSNYDDCKVNIERLDKMDMQVNWHKKMLFTPDMLKTFYEDMRNGYWEQFCNMIHFGGPNDTIIREQLLKLPTNDHYCQYFQEEEWGRLQAFNYDLMRRASKNKLEKKGKGTN
jgi:hypothetical protein